MPSLARIVGQGHPRKGYWVHVIRKSPNAIFGNILDGKGVADSEGRQIAIDVLDPDRYSCIPTALDLSTSSIRHFPFRIYGKVKPTNPSGEFEIFSPTGDPCPVGKGSAPLVTTPTQPIQAPAVVPPVPPVTQAQVTPQAIPLPSSPQVASSVQSVQAPIPMPAPVKPVPPPAPKPVVHKPKAVVVPTMTGVVGVNPDGTPTVSIDRVFAFLDALPIEQSIMLWGPAGVGKSAVVNGFGNDRNKKIFEVRLGAIDTTALQGIGVPDLIKMKCVWLPNEYIPTEPNSILFLDELTQATQTIQALAYQITLDRAIGSVRLPADCRVICAGNRITDRGVAFSMPSPLANRLFHLTIKPDISAWRKWAHSAGIDARIISFLSVKPDLLHAMDNATSGGAWPSPRSWASVNRVLNSTLTPAEMGIGIAANVGCTAAKDFVRHCGDFEKYTKKVLGILDGVERHYVESDPGRAITVAVAVVANTTDDIGTLTNVMEWAKIQNEEYSSIVVRGLEERFGEDLMTELSNINDSLGATIKKAGSVSESLPF